MSIDHMTYDWGMNMMNIQLFFWQLYLAMNMAARLLTHSYIILYIYIYIYTYIIIYILHIYIFYIYSTYIYNIDVAIQERLKMARNNGIGNVMIMI